MRGTPAGELIGTQIVENAIKLAALETRVSTLIVERDAWKEYALAQSDPLSVTDFSQRRHAALQALKEIGALDD